MFINHVYHFTFSFRDKATSPTGAKPKAITNFEFTVSITQRFYKLLQTHRTQVGK